MYTRLTIKNTSLLQCLQPTTHCLYATEAKTLEVKNVEVKPFSKIPGPFALPIIGNFYRLPKYIIQASRSNQLIEENFNKYGPIYKEQVFDFRIVYLQDVGAIEKMHRSEGRYPRRIIIESWRHWRDQERLKRGILTEDGHEWKRMRSVFDKRLMKPQFVAAYTSRFHAVVSDFIYDLDLDRNKHDNRVPSIDTKLFRWSLETIGTVLYEVRFGGVPIHFPSDLPTSIADGQKYIQAVQDIFESTGKLIYFPTHLNRIFFRRWQKIHEHSWDILFSSTQQLIDWKLKELEKGTASGGFLSSLLTSKDDLSTEEIYGNISDIMLGAVDTTSNTMQWMLYELSRNQVLQQELYDQIVSTVQQPLGELVLTDEAGSKLANYEHLQSMPLLKAVVKETLRLYPVANVTSRLLEEDIVLSGYQIPANTTLLGNTFLLGRDESLYQDALVFKPERWLRSTQATNKLHNFAWLPFGFGPRSCIGRRVAELEMYILLTRILQRYRLEPVSTEPLRPITRGLLVPHKPVNVRYIDRRL